MSVPGSTWKPATGKKFKYKCRLLNGLENFVDPAIIPLSERTDLPPEAKALLFTPETLPRSGGLESSMWYTPPSPPVTPTKSVGTIVSSTVNPTVKETISAKSTHCVGQANSNSSINSSLLNSTAKTFTPANMPFAPDAITSRAPLATKGLSTSRWAEPAHDSTTAQEVTSVRVDPAISNKIKDVPPHLRSNYIPPHLRTVQKAASAEIDPSTPIKAKDIPLHLRPHYIPPHLRPAGLTALPGKPILPFIEADQRAGVLPELIPNHIEYHALSSKDSCPPRNEQSTANSLGATLPINQVSYTSPVNGLENKTVDNPKPRTPYLASTFEDFMGRKGKDPGPKQILTTRLAPVSNISSNVTCPPSGCCSLKLSSDKAVTEMQTTAQKKENMRPGTSLPFQVPLAISPGKENQAKLVQEMKKDNQPELVEPRYYSTAEKPLDDNRVKQTSREFAKDLGEVILFEATNPQPGPLQEISDLTREALIRETGGAPKDSSGSGVEHFVSDDGVEVPIASDGVHSPDSPDNITPLVPDSRGYLAAHDTTLQQGDGSWMPVPCSWEDERPTFQDAFIPQFIANWAKTIPMVTGKVDMNRDEFKSGLSPISHLKFEEPLPQPLCYPDLQQSDNVSKQIVQTVEIEIRVNANRILKRHRIAQRQSQMATQPLYFAEDIIVNPNTPKIEIYLRPAQMKDISGITSIYHHYVLNSIIPEDQSLVTEETMQSVLRDAQEERLPFIVAIKGRVPQKGNTEIAEHVLGFAHIEFFNYGHSGNHTGASRFTGVVQVYVEPNHTRKGIGRSLMDRILVCGSTTHASKEGYDWTSSNSREDAVYGQQGGAHKFHQLLIHRRIEVNDDPDHKWLKQWLHGKFFIEEVAHLKSIARSSNRATTARMLDVLIFQFEAAHAGGFDITR